MGNALMRLLLPLGTVVFLLIVWEILTRALDIAAWLLPAPSRIVLALWDKKALLLSHLWPTLIEASLGLAVATVLAIVIASLMWYWPKFSDAMGPILVFSQTIPMIALAPLLVIWFGYGLLPKVLVVILVCFFPIVLSLHTGLQAVSPEHQKLFRSLGASRLQQFRWLNWPFALPHFFSGLRIAATYCVLGAVIAEWLGAQKGLGIFLTRSAKSFQTDAVFAAIIVISLLSLALVGMVNLVGRRMVRWQTNLAKN